MSKKIYATALVALTDEDGYILDCKGRCWSYLFEGSCNRTASDNLLEPPKENGLFLFEGRLRSRFMNTPDMYEHDEWFEGTWTRLSDADAIRVAQGTYELAAPADEEPGSDEPKEQYELDMLDAKLSAEEELEYLTKLVAEKARELGELNARRMELTANDLETT